MKALTFNVLLFFSLLVYVGEVIASNQEPQGNSTRMVVEVPEAILADYVGEYQLLPEMVMVITLEAGKLYATPTGQKKAELFPYETDQFFLTLVEATLSFSRDEKGHVTSLTILQNGEPYVAPRNP